MGAAVSGRSKGSNESISAQCGTGTGLLGSVTSSSNVVETFGLMESLILSCPIKEDELTESCVSDDDVHRLVYAKNAVGAASACASFDVGRRVALASPVVVDLERTLDASLRRTFD